ncbi:reverse transcriptase domain-containing protein [Tanacetum coccineum]
MAATVIMEMVEMEMVEMEMVEMEMVEMEIQIRMIDALGIELMKLMAKVYCPRTKIQKMESELWNLTMKNNDLTVYTQRFQELTMMYTKMVPEEEDRVEKFIGDDVRIANNLMDPKLKGYAMKNAENKIKFDNSQKDNRGQQPPNKRQNVGGQNVARAYTAGNNERRVYNGPLSLCNNVSPT